MTSPRRLPIVPSTVEEELQAWIDETRSYHADRQLADKVLLATGWRCLPDPEHPAKVKWEFGTNPVCTVWEPHHPHPVNSLDAALGQMPFKWMVLGMNWAKGLWNVDVMSTLDSTVVVGVHPNMELAACIAAVRAWVLERGDG